jgi:hypothetical protein
VDFAKGVENSWQDARFLEDDASDGALVSEQRDSTDWPDSMETTP